jgi:hypothetical protein
MELDYQLLKSKVGLAAAKPKWRHYGSTSMSRAGCGIVVAAPVQASSHAPLFLSLQLVKNMLRLM